MTVADPARAHRVLHAARPGSRPMDAEVLWALPRVGDPLPSPDGRRAVVPITTYDPDADEGLSRLWLVPVEGGAPRPLTSTERSCSQPAFSPDGSHLAFVGKAREKDAKAQVYVLRLDGGEAERLTDAPLGAFDPRWVPDGSGLVFGATLLDGHLTLEATRTESARRKEEPDTVHATESRLFRFWDRWLTDGRVPHLFRLDLEHKGAGLPRPKGDPVDLMAASTLWFSWLEPAGQYDLSPDGTEVVFAALSVGGPQRRLRTDVWRVALDGSTRAPVCLTARNGANSVRPRWTPDGRGIVYGRTHDPDFYADRPRLVRIDRATGTHGDLLTGWDRAPSAWSFGPDGRLYLQAEDDGAAAIFAFDVDRPESEPVRLADGGTCGAPRPTARGEVLFQRHGTSQPPEVHACAAAGGSVRRLTHFTEEALDGVALGEVRDVRFLGAQDEAVQMLVVLPPGHEEGRRHPLVHMIHGGPHGTFGDQWHFRWCAQAFAAPGYVVALVNFQGSTSWGNDFAQRIQGAWGDRPALDVLRATDVLVESGLVDPERMAISGGSYGGYLTAWLASHTDRFACAVNHAGVYDLTLQYASDVTWGRARNMGGEIWDEPDTVDRWNPARHAGGLNTPMLVIHGEKDYRVPFDHALVCYGILQARGIPSRLVTFEDENHWILKPRNSRRWYAEVLGWFHRFLGV